MTKRISNLMNRIKGFLSALTAGIIFLVSGITDIPVFGQSYIELVLENTMLDPVTQTTLGNILNIMMLISNFTGAIILIAAFLILFKRVRIAKIIILIVMAAGLFGFVIPIFVSITGGITSLSATIDAIASKYAVAVLLAMLSKQYASKIQVKKILPDKND
ncbi:MAG: hypothetical protein EU549_02200 [Promethearchaeota archaeon]|nr:MAG: hypothetical protein EU549_02200 [Candidatus Lokiarchaeota archaeon]